MAAEPTTRELERRKTESEHDASALTAPPEDALDEKPKRRERINMRMAIAGIRFARGEGSLAQCLIKSGFSRVTVRSATRNGLTVERCLEEAAKIDKDTSPSKLLEVGRATFLKTVAMTDPTTLSVRDATRALDVTEKYFGGHVSPTSPDAALSVLDRISTVMALALVLQERGSRVTAKGESPEAKTSAVITMEAEKAAE